MRQVVELFLVDAVDMDNEARALEELVRKGVGRGSFAKSARKAADSMLEGALLAERREAALVDKLLVEGVAYEMEATAYEAKAAASPPEGADFWIEMAQWKRSMAMDKVRVLLEHGCS